MGIGEAIAQFKQAARTSGFWWASSLVLDRFGVPALGWWKDRIISREALSNQVCAILRGWGMSQEHVETSIGHILYADLHGIDSHGCAMMIEYHRRLVTGKLNTTPTIQIINEGPTTALIDGGGGLGHVPADLAMKMAIAKCRESGVATVVVRNSGHYGAAGTYAAMAAREGLIGMATTNTRTPSVVPTFGVNAMLGTNPIAFAAPTKRNRPYLLDMATSTAPIGKLMNAWRAGEPIPLGWALDPTGRPTTSPRKASLYRRLTPLGSTREMGSHKGYGLATMVEVLSSILPGLRSAQTDGEPRVGHFFMAMDPARFREPGAFQADMDSMIDSMRDCKPAQQDQPVQVAGDQEYRAEQERSKQGIPLTRCVIEDLRYICLQSNVPFTLDMPPA